MHSEIQVNGSTIIFCEATEEWKVQPDNLFVYVKNADLTYKKAIDAGASTTMELNDQDYGRTCGVEDPFDNVWRITGCCIRLKYRNLQLLSERAVQANKSFTTSLAQKSANYDRDRAMKIPFAPKV